MTTTFKCGARGHFERAKLCLPKDLWKKGMTRKQFEKLRFAIEGEKFQDEFSDPISYGIHRAAFDREKFIRLIAAAEQVDTLTTRAKLEQWKRQLARAVEAQQRFERLREEIGGGRAVAPPNEVIGRVDRSAGSRGSSAIAGRI
jgi:hypothetical protein